MGYRNQFVDGIKTKETGRWDFERPIHRRGERWVCGVCGGSFEGKRVLRDHKWAEHSI